VALRDERDDPVGLTEFVHPEDHPGVAVEAHAGSLPAVTDDFVPLAIRPRAVAATVPGMRPLTPVVTPLLVTAAVVRAAAV
jgi:hypothetical protein